jgi:phosphatidylinositol-bisphosphatase
VQVRPKYGVLLPGESAELRITVIVDDKAARALARGERELEDVLILHVEGGNDTFISVTGSYLTSCYGSSIQSLLALTTPARYSENLASEVHNPHLPPIPKEVWRLCGAILDRGMDEEKIFFICGDEAEVFRPCSISSLENFLSQKLRRTWLVCLV